MRLEKIEIEHEWLGIQKYSESLNTQKKYHQKRVDDHINDSVIFLEHYPVITIGRTGSDKDVLSELELLKKSKIEIVNTNRGGETTFHGPGQLIGYLFIKIKDLNLTPISYVRLLEKVLVLSYLEYGLQTMTLKGKTGVWVPGDKKNKKIAAIGVRISNGVTMHGFSANISNDLSDFKHIIPCGMPKLESTSLKKELSLDVELKDFSIKFMKNLCEEIGQKNNSIILGVNS
ncbi:MAG: octanoyltransferase [Chloroflexi bacterium]|nr:octanoyltransferase [Chloroflexota bacterium]|tara:strand:- start:10262 stop:10954 length:693 start_codon:yes stop_codon:yes gene_type:complete